MTTSISLRDYQIDVINQTYQHFDSGKVSVLLYAPTGAGKTVIASQVIADYVKKGKRVMFMVHRGKLVRQTLDKLSKLFGIEAGVIWSDYYTPDYSKPVQIAMLQTIRNRELPPDIDLVILDEAHTGAYFKIWSQIMDYYSGGIWLFSKTQFLGLSATPWRAKSNQGYCQFFQTIVKAPYPNQLIEQGDLCRARQFGYTHLIDESKLKVVDGEYTEKSMAEVCTPALNTEIVKIYLEKDPEVKRKLIAFCATVKQAEDLAYQFNLVGIEAECIVGETPDCKREEAYEKFSKGTIKLISSCNVLTEGFDEPTVTSLLVCRPVKSRALWVQMTGRGLRRHQDKEDCWFFDFCGNIKRLKLPTEAHELSLCPSNKPLKVTSTKICPECDSTIPFYERYCPHCGYMFDSLGKKAAAASVKRKFEEILSSQQQKQVKYIKTLAINAYNNRKPIDIEKEFYKKFNYLMPEEWYNGLIFNSNEKTWNAALQHYWRYMLQINKDVNLIETRARIERCIQREFKSGIMSQLTNLDVVFDEQKKEKVKRLIAYQPWWLILGQSKPIDADSIQIAYTQTKGAYQSRYAPDADTITAYAELLDMAITEAIEYHTIDPETIEKHVHNIKTNIRNGAFKFVSQYILNLTQSAKERVWNQLTRVEKELYRTWKEKFGEIPVQQHTVKTKAEIQSTDIAPPVLKTQPKEAPISKYVTTAPILKNAANARQENSNQQINTNTQQQINIPSVVNNTVAAKEKTSSVMGSLQLTLFPESEAEKAINDVYNPLRLCIDDWVKANNPKRSNYNDEGRILKIHPSDKRLCYVDLKKSGRCWCRLVDLKRAN
ncbi:hypothetical protein CAL7716_100330 (plasmid) [Calothrix sp. PCC 7716]|nr:hypothetical protein CAL7716_100330 [Calothrix sp. PCC 7716]